MSEKSQEGVENSKSNPSNETINSDEISKISKENEGLRQAQSTLTKSNEELRKELEAIKASLKAVAGTPPTDDEGEVDVKKIASDLTSQLLDLKRENAVSKAVNSMTLENGDPVPQEVLSKALKLANTQGLGVEDAVQKVEEVVNDLLELQNSVKKVTSSSKEPESSGGLIKSSKIDIEVFR